MKKLALIIIVSVNLLLHGQDNIGNYVSNGSFESLNSFSVSGYYQAVESWQSIDTNKYAYYLVTEIPPIANAPYVQGYQFARTGKNYVLSSPLCYNCVYSVSRGYPRNRLKKQLKANTSYCVKFYLNCANSMVLATDSYAAYFGDNGIDSIKYCSSPITYLTPQVQNLPGNYITDTLGWTAVTGTFIATGTEKYMVLGNFRSDVGTNTMVVNTSSAAITGGIDICIDDVSVIEMNLPAYAGRDTIVTPGTPVFIGREPDFAIDSGCTWYQWPNMSVPIYDKAGLWINPTVTTTYVVKQVLDCSSEKWDTVVIYVTPVGIERLKILQNEIRVLPIPSNNYLELIVENKALVEHVKGIKIYNQIGQLVREEEIRFVEGSVKIDTRDLPMGIYSLCIINTSNESVSRKLIISR